MKRAERGKGEAGLKARARAVAAGLGHDLAAFRHRGAAGVLLGRCRRCMAAIVFRPQDAEPSPRTGDYFDGSAVTKPCDAAAQKRRYCADTRPSPPPRLPCGCPLDSGCTGHHPAEATVRRCG